VYISTQGRRVNEAHARVAVAAAVEAGTRSTAITGLPILVWSSVSPVRANGSRASSMLARGVG
jgi:hypothetical protein